MSDPVQTCIHSDPTSDLDLDLFVLGFNVSLTLFQSYSLILRRYLDLDPGCLCLLPFLSRLIVRVSCESYVGRVLS